MKTFYSIIIWIYWAVCIISFFFLVTILFIITFTFDRYNQIPNRVLGGLAKLMLKVNPGWTFDIKGAERQKIARPTIIVANHQSFLDLPLFYLLPWSMKWVSKRSLFKIPILGWIIYMTGQLGIDRKSIQSAKKLAELVEPVKHGIPAMFFPEGTRTRTGALKPFKNGAFKLAMEYNFRILPVVLNGGYEAMPSGTWKVNARQHFTISVLDSVETANFDDQDVLKESVRSMIDAELSSLRHHA